MKELILMRHAKSDWSTEGQADFDRPINERGQKSAQVIGAEIAKLGFIPDLILSSAAVRAKQTTILLAKSINIAIRTIFLREIYEADEFALLSLIRQTDQSVSRLMIVGHNPTMEDLAAMLVTGFPEFIEMPTASLLRLELPVEKWKDLKHHTCKVKNYIRPKLLGI